MKSILKFLAVSLAALLAQHAEGALGCRTSTQYGEQVLVPGLTAAVSLNNHQYGVVRLAAATTVNICSEVDVSSALAAPFGILQNKPYVNEPAQVCVMGLSQVFAGGTITAGAYLSYDSSGHVINANSGEMVIGRALEAATTAGEKALALIFPPIRWAV